MEINLSHSGNQVKSDKRMKTRHFYDYYPQRLAQTSESVSDVRNLIYKFKDGDKQAAIHAARLMAELLWHWYSHHCREYVIVCVPSSSMAEYRKRFSYFSAIVADRCGQDNAMPHVHIFGKRDALHRSIGHVVREADGYSVSVDADFFRGRKVIVFDDLITTGTTAENFSEQLRAVGADVRGGLFLARTVGGGILKRTYWGQFAEHSLRTMRLASAQQERKDYRKEISAMCSTGAMMATIRNAAAEIKAISEGKGTLCLPVLKARKTRKPRKKAVK